mmetsp:Transcript_25922/g.72326  ORF Transcript_25922/g.72326 Transcript_25922/m.72326 type:complete len:206 (-) Transcript_25922:586-1203(-)
MRLTLPSPCLERSFSTSAICVVARVPLVAALASAMASLLRSSSASRRSAASMPFSFTVFATAFVCTSFTCWQNFMVESVSSKSIALGDMAAIITVLEFPQRASLRTWVSFESRKGGLLFLLPAFASSDMTLAKVERALLMAAPSFKRSPSALVRLARSEPARSTRCVCDVFVVPSGSTKPVLKVKTQWLLLLDAFIAVADTRRFS